MNNFFQIPDFAQVDRSQQGLLFRNQLRPYWADCEAGVFRRTRDSDLGDRLTIQVFNFRWFEGERFRFPFQSWLDLAFIDSDGVAAALPLKKESATNVAEWLLMLETWQRDRSIDPSALRLTLQMSPRETMDGLGYYAVIVGSWEFVSPQEYEGLRMFLSQNPGASEFPLYWENTVEELV